MDAHELQKAYQIFLQALNFLKENLEVKTKVKDNYCTVI